MNTLLKLLKFFRDFATFKTFEVIKNDFQISALDNVLSLHSYYNHYYVYVIVYFLCSYII